jgi:tRNA uridine 5-carboxymethylaminomethyl modification enzyme
MERNLARSERQLVRLPDESVSVAQALARPPVTLADVEALGFALETAPGDEAFDQASFAAHWKYQGYLKRHDAEWRRTLAQEARSIPVDFDYRVVPGLSREVAERLTSVRPLTIGQAFRVPGVTPAALAIVAARVLGQRAKGRGKFELRS